LDRFAVDPHVAARRAQLPEIEREGFFVGRASGRRAPQPSSPMPRDDGSEPILCHRHALQLAMATRGPAR
jgi:hypothetical protein